MDKVYLILGASSDVGMAYIEKLINSSEGGNINIIAVYRTMSERFAKILESGNETVNLLAIQADLSMPDDVEKLIETINDEELVPTHILHLAAGKFEYMKVKSWNSSKVAEDMQISFFAFARICKEYLPLMAKAKYGKVVVMLTAYVLGKPPKFMSDYLACKGALLGYMKGIAAEYADKGININAVSPNMMETKFLEGLDERIVAMTAESSSKKRNIEVGEVVNAVNWLMSDEASYANGMNLNLSGGDYMS